MHSGYSLLPSWLVGVGGGGHRQCLAGGGSLWRIMWCGVAMGVVAEPPACEVAVDV
jgi:hypothetical protein